MPIEDLPPRSSQNDVINNQCVIHGATEDEYKCLAHGDFRSVLLQDCIVMGYTG